MAKKQTEANGEVNQDQAQTQIPVDNTGEVVEVKQKADRTPRLKVETSLPSAENNWQGTVNLTAVGLEDKPLVYTYGIGGELSKFFLQIIESGLKARFSVVIGGLKTPEEVYKALEKEIVNLNSGIFSIRTPKEATASFSDTVIAMALVHVAKTKAEFPTVYPVVSKDTELLSTKQDEWAAMTKEERSKLITEPFLSAARKAVAYFRSMEEFEKAQEEISAE